MTGLRRNVIANFGGQAWGLLINLAFVPVYIRILGIEAYGLIGFFLSLQAFLVVLDVGLGATVNRELARGSHSGLSADGARDLVRTLEWIYWPTGSLIAIGVFAMSGPIATHWLKPVALSVQQTTNAIAIMGLAAGVQWPNGLYAGGLLGLERQVALNGLNALFATVRVIGAVAVVLYFWPTLTAFLWWQVTVTGAQTLITRGVMWHYLPRGTRGPRLALRSVNELREFALGMAGITALSFILTQSDRLLLSNLLPLNEFGYYAVAASAAAAMTVVVGPFFNALYPRFSKLVAAGDEQKLIILYHQGNQLLAVLVTSVAAVLASFAGDVLRVWTHNPQLAAKSGPLLSILVIGTALNGLLHLPYALQLANGWTRLALFQNVITAALVVPGIWILGQRYGGMGAASVWVAVNLASATIGIPLMHKRFLQGEMSAWYWGDIIPPAGVAVFVAGALSLYLPPAPYGLRGFLYLSAIGLFTLACTSLATRSTRQIARSTSSALLDRCRAYMQKRKHQS